MIDLCTKYAQRFEEKILEQIFEFNPSILVRDLVLKRLNGFGPVKLWLYKLDIRYNIECVHQNVIIFLKRK